MYKFLIAYALFIYSIHGAVLTNINVLAVNAASNQYPANLRVYGAIPDDSLTDDVALANALAARGEIWIGKGTFNINTNVTISSTNNLTFDFGGILKPASGVTITIRGGVKAGPTQQIFDISAGGKILFQNTLGTGVAKVDKIWAGWWGPDHNNSGTTGDDTKLAAWLQSTAASVNTEKWIAQGFYTVNTPLTISNKWRVYGSGMPTISGSIAANTSVFKVADSSDDVVIDGFAISAYTSGTGTNVYGIEIGLDCDRGTVRNTRFSGKLYGGAIYNSGNSLYWTFKNLFATGLDNSTANGGNGNTTLWPSVFVRSTNIFSRTTFEDCVVVNCNGGLVLHGGANTNSGNISWIGGGFEGVGSLTLSTNVITLHNISQFDIQNAHFENITNVNMIHARGVKQFNSTDTLYSGDYGGTVKTTNLLNFVNVGRANIRGGRMSNPLSYYIINGTMSKAPDAWGVYFDTGGYTMASDSDINARMSGTVNWEFDDQGAVSGVYTPTMTGLANVDSVTAQEAQYMRVGNTVTVSGIFDIDPTAGGGADTQISISLPVASTFTNGRQAGGIAASSYLGASYGNIQAAVTGVVHLFFDSNSTASIQMSYTFTYQIL